ncbi:MAG: heme-dependent oxidative N-demethylase subunit alpha family protein [Fimbriimonas sp.]
MSLAPRSWFAPWSNGVYSVSPALRPLGTDYGNGDADGRLILIDQDFHRYRANKDAAYAEDRSKYWTQVEGFSESRTLGRGSSTVLSPPKTSTTLAACRAIATRLATDYPSFFVFESDVLTNGLTRERVAWNADGTLDKTRSILPPDVDHPLEALALQIQCDLALIVRKLDGRDYNAAIHLCAPSHWAAADKIGRSFFQVHAGIPGFEKVNAVARGLVDAMICRKSLVRFVWGVESDDRLNHHPAAPPKLDQAEWDGRNFESGKFWVRTERQTTLGMPDVDAALFFIHVQTVPGNVVLQMSELRESLRAGLLSMSPEARRYKGLEPGFDRLIGILDSVRSE